MMPSKPLSVRDACLTFGSLAAILLFAIWCGSQYAPTAPEMHDDHHGDITTEIDAAIAASPPQAVGYGSPAEDLRAKYATAYNHARKIRLAECDHCQACGLTDKQLKKLDPHAHLETHHIVSVLRIFNEGLDPDLIGDPKNLEVLCRNGPNNCHIKIGHNGNTKTSNPNVVRDAAKRLRQIQSKTTQAP